MEHSENQNQSQTMISAMTHTQKYCPEHSFTFQYYHVMKSTFSVNTSLITKDYTEHHLKKNNK